MRNRVVCMTLAVCIGISVCTGCGANKSEGEATEETGRKSTGQKGLAQFEGQVGNHAETWKDTFTASRKGEEVSVKISADIEIPEAAQMDVCVAQPMELAEDNRKSILSRIFEEVYSFEESCMGLKKLLDEAESNVENWENYLADGDYTGYSKEEGLAKLNEEKKKAARLKDKMKTNPQPLVETEDYHKMNYIGKRDGYIYGIYLNQWDDDIFYENEEEKTGCRYEGRRCGIQISLLAVEDDAKLEQELDDEQKKAIADQFVEDCGLTNYECVRQELFPDDYLSQIIPQEREKEIHMYDYRLRYSPINIYQENYQTGIGEIIGQILQETGEKPDSYNEDTSVYIKVGSFGELDVGAAWWNVRSVTENVTLMSLDEVKKIIRHELETDIEQFHFMDRKEYLFTDLQLDYVRIRNTSGEDTYSFIPAWRLSTNGDMNYALFNGMDGSVIDLATMY